MSERYPAFTASAGRRAGKTPSTCCAPCLATQHAGGMIDELLTDDAYLLHADLRRLIPAADACLLADRASPRPAAAAHPRAITADPGRARGAVQRHRGARGPRAQLFHRPTWQAPYRAQWATVQPPKRTRHPGRPPGRGQRGVRVTGQRPDPARQRRQRRDGADLGSGHRSAARQSCTATELGPCDVRRHASMASTLLASGGDDGTVRIWDPATGQQRAVLKGHTAGSRRCALSRVDGQLCWLAPATTERCGSGTRPPANSTPA